MIVRHSSFRGDVSVRLDGDDEDDARLARRIGRGRHKRRPAGFRPPSMLLSGIICPFVTGPFHRWKSPEGIRVTTGLGPSHARSPPKVAFSFWQAAMAVAACTQKSDVYRLKNRRL